MKAGGTSRYVRFGPFELDLRAGRLSKNGTRIRIPEQSIQVLVMLVERAGDMITREELHQRLWPNGTIVEFDHGINSAVKRLRHALRDSVDTPRFIETLRGKGYRFISPVEMVQQPSANDERPELAMVSHYRIIEKLAHGGMGIVYRAEDINLGRPAALKFLPEEMAQDEQMLERFRREARSASALNHPNICTIYEIGDDGGRPFIAMELLQGQNLSEVLAAGPIEVERLLAIALQAATALEAAHNAGIIHRDVKPANIFITRSEQVKLLDFGIAKSANVPACEAPADGKLRLDLTRPGTPVGTVAYMSPEQAEGKEVDARSDIFSFGAVLYEMVTGRRAFHGDSKLSTLSAILKDEPGPLPSDIPRDLEKIIVRCLRKDPGRRFQHADDLKLALLELKEESDLGKMGASAAGSASRKTHKTWMAASAVILALIFLGLWMRSRTPTAPRVAPKMVPLTSYPGRQRSPALSPDGKQVAFSWNGEDGDKQVAFSWNGKGGDNFDIYVKLVDGGSPLRLTTNPADEDSPGWSPEGSRIAFLRFQDTTASLVVVPSLGGPERKLAQITVIPELYYGSSLAWSPDGKFLAVPDRPPNEVAGIFLISAESGQKHRVTSPPRAHTGDSLPSFSPDGRSLAFVRTPSNYTDEIYVVPLGAGVPAGEPRRITSSDNVVGGLDWTPDGGNIVFSRGDIGAAALRIVRVTGGQPEPLAGSGENGLHPSVSRQGSRLAYERFIGDSNIWRLPGPRSSQRTVPPQKWIASTQSDLEPQYAPDGKRLVFSSMRGGAAELWTCDVNGGEPTQLTSFGGPPPGSPRWSPDSRLIAFDGPQSGKTHISVINAEGGTPHHVTQGATNNVRPSWSGDGKWIYFGSNRTGEWQIWKAPAQGGNAIQVTRQGGREALESPDGNRLLYTKNQKPGVWSVPVGGGQETQVMEKGGQNIWAVAKDGICFFDWKDALHSTVQFYSFSSRRLTTLYEFPRGTNLDRGSTGISVSPDERWILYTKIDQAGSNLVLVENFH